MEIFAGAITFAKFGLALMQLANYFLAKADKQELRNEGFKEAVAATGVKTLEVVGITAKAFGRVAGWTDEQVIDDLTKPPVPRS